MKKIKPLFYCLLSALFLAISFPGLNISILAWFSFLPLLFAIENKTKMKAFWLSYLCGFAFFILILYWLVHVTLIGLLLLCLYLALYFAFFGYFFAGFTKRQPQLSLSLIIFLSCIWVMLEYLRSHLLSGFPWALLGYSQYQNIKLIQFCDITGSLGLSFLVIFVNLCLFKIIKDRRLGNSKSIFNITIILSAIFILIYAYGIYSINKYSRSEKPLLKVSLIQGNIPQEEKWSLGFREKIKARYLDLSIEAAKDSPDIIIWPETSYPEYIVEEDQDSIAPVFSVESEIKIPILFGSVYQDDEKYFNSAILLKGAKVRQIYKKIHLVPFGEYFPLRKYLFFLEPIVPIGDFNSGDEFVIFNIDNKFGELVSFGVLICFEDTIPELSREFVLRGADFLVNITNDAWFKKTSSPYQHLQASVFRAVENRVYLLRAANTGITCIIDNRGQVIKRMSDKKGEDIFVKGFITGQVNKYSSQQIQKVGKSVLTFYAKFADWFILFCILFTAWFSVHFLMKKTR